MSLPLIHESDFDALLMGHRPMIDVRAPVEFHEGSIPGSVNFPIMDDSERAEIGTIYKEKGQEAAIERGHQLVSGEIRESRILVWLQFIEKNPEAIITCFRGGLRSKTAQQWILDQGITRPRIEGGYKKMRQHLMQIIEKFVQTQSLMVISGATGSGKSLLLRSLAGSRKVSDLERWANHRGSAFGGYAEGQPTQIDFENRMAVEMLGCLGSSDPRATLIEDESRLVGRCVQPTPLFEKLRVSPIVLVEENIESRVQVTFEDYILGSKLISANESEALQVMERYRQSLKKISKKLGGVRTAEVSALLESAWTDQTSGRGFDAHREWIKRLLVDYYDPMYLGSLESRGPNVLFRGSRSSCFEYLKSES